MASPNSSAPTTVPRDIEEKLDNFQSQVLLMILSYVNGIFQDTAPSLMEHLLKLERDNNSFSGIINYTFKRLKVNPALFFTPDRGTVQLPQVKAEGIELRLALVNFIISFNDQQAASRAIKNIAKEGSSLLAQQRTPLEIIEEVCKRRSFKDVVSISTSVAQEFNGARFFKHLHNTDWLHNRDDVNQFLREESGFSSLSGEMALFMTQKLSISDYTLISISKKLCGVCQKHPKGAIFCISVPIALLAFLLVGVGISIGISYLSPISTIQSMEIGDKQSSSALIPVPNNVYSVSLNIPSGVTEFMALSIPPTGTQIINRTKIFQSDGHCAPYNVNNGDNPVYLLPGSIMNYTLTVSDSNSSQCPAQLVLLNNRAEYLKCNYNSSSVVKVYCLASGTVNHVSIRINKSANYYVVLVKEDLTISVSSNISVHQVYYDTTHLSPANDCEQNDASPCTVHNDDQWSCSNTEWYVILQSSSNVDVGYNYKTPSFNYCRLIVSLNSTPVIAIILALLIGCCLVSQRKKICNKCKGSGSGRNESIQNNLPSLTGYAPIP